MKSQPMTGTATTGGEGWDVLVVDTEAGGAAAIAELVKKVARSAAGRVRVARSAAQAHSEMKSKPADILLINLQVHESAGLNLIKSLRPKYPQSSIIAVSPLKRGGGTGTNDVCLSAWRAGAADMLVAPLQSDDVRRSLLNVMNHRSQVEVLAGRNVRLRRVCKQLNKARHEIRQQVDLLCNDLVRAYQDMAQQLNSTSLAADYATAIGNELEIEGLLRRTMEWILAKLGPVNAAVYLSDAEHHFALGAYLNLDTQADGPIIEAISETIVKHCQTSARTLALESDSAIEQLFGREGAPLLGRCWAGAGCFTPRPRNDCLAVLVVFRKAGEALDSVRMMIDAVAPLLGQRIEEALGFYHRLHPDAGAGDDSDAEYQQ